jgi:hypothetical protein
MKAFFVGTKIRDEQQMKSLVKYTVVLIFQDKMLLYQKIFSKK